MGRNVYSFGPRNSNFSTVTILSLCGTGVPDTCTGDGLDGRSYEDWAIGIPIPGSYEGGMLNDILPVCAPNLMGTPNGFQPLRLNTTPPTPPFPVLGRSLLHRDGRGTSLESRDLK